MSSRIKNQPAWKRNFPIEQEAEHRVSRREALAFMGVTGACCGFGRLVPRGESTHAIKGQVFDLGPMPELERGQGRIVEIETGPVLLIRLDDGRMKAYDARCTHLLCPVHYDGETDQIVCPCHHGFFSAEDGSPLAGPPRIPLHEFALRLVENTLYLARDKEDLERL